MGNRPMWATILFGILLIGGCSQAPTDADGDGDPTPEREEVLEMEGLWLAQYGHEGDESSHVTRTLEFGEAASGQAAQLEHDERSNVVRCEETSYALLVDGDVRLGNLVYDVERRSDDELRLTYALGDGELVLDLSRLEERPFDPCGSVETESFANLYTSIHQNTKLHFGGDGDLYFTLDTNSDAVARFEMGTEDIEEEYPDPVYSLLVGVDDENLVFGSCHCGGRDTLEAYDLATSELLASVDDLTHPDGSAIDIQAGYYDRSGPGEMILAVRVEESGTNHLFTVTMQDDDDDPTTPDMLVLQDEREILEGASIQDVAVVDDELLALVSGAIVRVGDDGRAVETLSIEGFDEYARGIANVGSVLYVLHESNERGYLRAALLP